MKIFVVGKLGEVIKKVIELEDAIRETPDNVIFIAELAAYNQVLQMWPVLDKDELTQAIDEFRFCLSNLREKETTLRNNEYSHHVLDIQLERRYLKALDETRANMAYINELGMHIGASPVLEVEDANSVRVD
jgi:hypothetical protein